jgi:hypothetical protein
VLWRALRANRTHSESSVVSVYLNQKELAARRINCGAALEA